MMDLTVIISPHIDDAILSIGGLISNLAAENKPIRIEYIFSKSNWINQDALFPASHPKSTEAITELRKLEEQEVSRKLGYKYAFMDFPDLALQEGIDPSELKVLKDEVSNKISSLVNLESTYLFPLGCLENADHHYLNSVGLNLMHKGYKVGFYEDMPYYACGYYDYSSIYEASVSKGLKPELIKIDFEEKCELLKLYQSQVSFLWLKDLKNYSYSLIDNAFYERVWLPKADAFNHSQLTP
jgi:LmbE family N-acetylglucosaminyl deacetylase